MERAAGSNELGHGLDQRRHSATGHVGPVPGGGAVESPLFTSWADSAIQTRALDRLFLRRAAIVGAAAAIGANLLGLGQLGIGVTCPFRRITGIPCPFCGSTTAVAALGGGQISKALVAAPFLVVLASVLMVSWLPAGWTNSFVSWFKMRTLNVTGRQRKYAVVGLVCLMWLWQLAVRPQIGIV
jgi:Protein of unknown function (DUF2752)